MHMTMGIPRVITMAGLKPGALIIEVISK